MDLWLCSYIHVETLPQRRLNLVGFKRPSEEPKSSHLPTGIRENRLGMDLETSVTSRSSNCPDMGKNSRLLVSVLGN